MSGFPNPERGFPDRGLDDSSASMDAAQKSLTDALRIMYKLLLVVMILMGVMFLFSGLQTVSESEKGVKLRFGAVTEDDVPPGWTLVAPFPAGELIKVQTGQVRMDLTSSFGPPREAGRSMSNLIAQVADLNPLDPKASSLMTADIGIAHTWWTVLWNRNQPAANVRNLLADDEIAIVRAAVENAIVRVTATTTLDSLLKLRDLDVQGTGGSSVEQRVREMAQRSLEEIGAGVTISSVLLAERLPPGNARREFQMVLAAEANAGKEVEDARSKAQQSLLQAAGLAHKALTALIDEYEDAIELGDTQREANALAQINAIIDGERVEVEGQMVSVTGDVKAAMSAAREYRTNQVNEWRARAETFETKLQLYEQQPKWFIANEWASAYGDFLAMTDTEVFRLPNKAWRIDLNSNPAIGEAREREEGERVTGASILKREDRFQENLRREARERRLQNQRPD